MVEDRGSTVLVTGGSGFLGGWCVIELLRRGYAVRTTVRSLSREPQMREPRRLRGGCRRPADRARRRPEPATTGWPEAVEGCDYVLHVASPFPPKQPKDPDELIVPAREGTLRVLRAGLDAGVKRVVVTSSVAAIRLSDEARRQALTEEDWTDPDAPGLTPYVRSKTIAEQAAWDLVRERGEEDRLAVVNPGAIIGPVLNDDLSYSLQSVQRLLNGMPGMPRLGFSLVDVRDVADLEIRAMTAPEAGGERFIATTQVPLDGGGRGGPPRSARRRRLQGSHPQGPGPPGPGHGAVRSRDPLGRRWARKADRAVLGEGEEHPRLDAPPDRGHDRRDRREPDPPRRGARRRLALVEVGLDPGIRADDQVGALVGVEPAGSDYRRRIDTAVAVAVSEPALALAEDDPSP